MKAKYKMQKDKEIPIWLKRLDLVRAELKGMRFPRTAEDGLRQCADLSAAPMGLVKEETGESLRAGEENTMEEETRRLMAGFSPMDARWKDTWSKKDITPKGQ